MKSKTTIETIKFALRMTILFAPVILGVIADAESQGWLLALSGALATVDKLVHETESIKAQGIVPF